MSPWTPGDVAKALKGAENAGLLVSSIEFKRDGSMHVAFGPDPVDWARIHLAKLKSGHYAFTDDQFDAIKRFVEDA